LVGKTPLIVAPLLVGLAFLALAFVAGRFWERAGKRYASSFIDPKTHGDLMDALRRILTPPADVDQACFVPEVIKAPALRVLATADEQAAKRRREELRRRGW
jgi:hypothetical protein